METHSLLPLKRKESVICPYGHDFSDETLQLNPSKKGDEEWEIDINLIIHDFL